MTKRQKGIIFGALASVLLGANLAPAKLLLERFSPLFITISTGVISGFILLPLLILIKKIPLRVFKGEDLLLLIFIGILSSGLAVLFVYRGLDLVPISEAVFLLQLEVAFASIVAYLWLKERLNQKQIAGIFTMFAGVYFMTGISSFSLSAGQIFLILAAALFGITDIMTKRVDKSISPLIISGMRSLFGAIFLTPFFILNFDKVPQIDVASLSLILINSIMLFYGVGFLYQAIKLLHSSEGSLFVIPATLIGALIGVLFFKESMTFVQVFGGSLIILGLVVANYFSKEYEIHS